MQAKGRDIITGLPKTVTVRAHDIMEALKEPISLIMDAIKSTLEQTPPELAADIVNSGMMLAGGGALLRGLDRLIENQTGMKVIVADNALEAVAEGTGRSVENIERTKRYVYGGKRY